MQWIAVATPPFASIEQFDRVMDQLGEEPEGLEARYVGTADEGLRVVTLWESKAHADQFFAEPPRPGAGQGPRPRTRRQPDRHRHRGSPRLHPPTGLAPRSAGWIGLTQPCSWA